MQNLDLKFHGNIFLFIFLLALLVGFSIYVYRRTIPPVPGWFKKILTALRAIALALVLFILFEPILGISWHKTEKPIVAVLLDSSASMSLTDDGKRRSERARAILNSEFIKNISGDNEVEFYQFSDHLAPLVLDKMDSLRFDSDGTDLTTALKSLREKNLDRYLKAVVLITDGINNLGENPARYAEDFDVPIFPIAIARAVEQKDILISKVVSNQVSYANSKVPVEVSLRSFGFAGKKIKVELLKDTNVIDSKYVTISDDRFETKLRLQFTPEAPGFRKYTVRIPAQSGELTTINNRKNFYTRVLKSKMKILFLAGSPDPDFKFIKKNLQADENIAIDFWVIKKNQQFYQGRFPSDPNKLKPYDCIILQNFPGPRVAPYVMTTLKQLLEARQTPLLFVAGNNINPRALTPLKTFLPLEVPFYSSGEMLVIPRLTAAGTSHPVTRITDDEYENQQTWRQLPPIYLSIRRARLYPASQTLVEVDPDQTLIRGRNGSLPLVVAQKMGQHKSLAILGYGIWRWDLMMWGIGKTNQAFKQFLSNSIRWLVTKEDSKLVRIYPDQKIYRNGQQVTFTAEVYTEDYRPLEGAEIRLTVKSQHKSYQILLSEIGDGKYEGTLQALQGGDYFYEGVAQRRQRELGRDSGRFSVENFNLEFLRTRVNESLLQQLALKTGGKFLTDTTYQSLDKLLHFPVKKTLASTEMQLWNKLILLIVVIALLAAEWFLRKRTGML